jgi:hypothetical protein
MRNQISKTHADLARQFSERMVRDLRQWRTDLEFGASRFDDSGFHDLMRSHVNQWRAKLTEMDVFFSLSGARKLSMRIGEDVEMSVRLKDKIKQYRDKMRTQPQYRVQFQNQFSSLLETDWLKSQRVDQMNSDEMLNTIQEWIQSKEIDVVYEVQGRSIWLEVKNYNRPFTESMLRARDGKRSILSQLSENQAILDFLGLNQEASVGFYSASGILPDAKYPLNRAGIQVLGE